MKIAIAFVASVLVAGLPGPKDPGYVAVAAGAQPQTQAIERTVYLNEQQSFTPGYLVGDIALGNPAIADFKVLPGRRELLLFGKSAGKTTLTIWDQQGIKRHEITITVADRKTEQTERELRELLKSYPGLEVHTLAGSLVVTGVVTTQGDKEAVEKIASAAGARNLVRFDPPTQKPSSDNPMPQPTAAAPTGAAGGRGAAVPAGSVEYQLEVLEASVQFRSGSYATGVEPSGRSLFKQTLTVAIDQEGKVFVPGETIAPRDAPSNVKTPPKNAAEPIGLHLTIRPGAPGQNGTFANYLLIETNVPVGQFTDTSTMRRARWQFPARTGEPIGIGGGELLAVVDTQNGPGALNRTRSAASMFAMLPGISGNRGTSYATSMPSYDAKRKTQLLLIVRPKFVAPGDAK